MSSTPRAVILHGYTADPAQNWFAGVARDLAADGIRVDVPALPDSRAPRPEAWISTAVEAIGTPSPRLVVVGHSLGCITALRALERIPGDWELAGAILVAGFTDRLANIPTIAPFTAEPIDLAPLVARIRRRVVLVSDDDATVAPPHTRALAADFDAELLEFPGAGHFLDRQGFTDLPVVSALVRSMLDRG